LTSTDHRTLHVEQYAIERVLSTRLVPTWVTAFA
jgi:hypothetical protein